MAKLPPTLQPYAFSAPPVGVLTLRGSVHASDGRADLTLAAAFDFAAGGFSVTVDGDAVHLFPTGQPAPGCAGVQMIAPCLLPRTAALAHDALLTPDELVRTATVDVEIDPFPTAAVAMPPSLRISTRPGFAAGELAALVVAGALAAALAISFVRSAARSPMGAVLRAARTARRATRRDPTLAAVRSRIDDLVEHARALDRLRRVCRRKRARVDRAALANGLAAERDEAGRLEIDLAGAEADMARVASALRLVTLHAREGRNQATSRDADPIAALEADLAIRDEAIAEAHAARGA